MAAAQFHTGVAMGADLFDACAREGLVIPRLFDSYRVGFTTSVLGEQGLPVFVRADLGSFEFMNGLSPEGHADREP